MSRLYELGRFGKVYVEWSNAGYRRAPFRIDRDERGERFF